MTLSLKPGVKVGGVDQEIVLAIMLCREVYADMGKECVVTSITDGKHSKGSLHYSGRAFDVRTRHVPADQRAALRNKIAAALGPEFDVVLESDHLHCEFDPD